MTDQIEVTQADEWRARIANLEEFSHEPVDIGSALEEVAQRSAAYALAKIGLNPNGNAKDIVAALNSLAASRQCPQAELTESPTARPLDEWHEDYGDVVWWKFPITEPAMIGNPLDSAWPGYHTHWTQHPPIPAQAIHAQGDA